MRIRIKYGTGEYYAVFGSIVGTDCTTYHNSPPGMRITTAMYNKVVGEGWG